MTRVFTTPYMNTKIQHKCRRCESTSADEIVETNKRDNKSTQDKTREEKTRQDKTRQDKTRDDKPRQDQTG